MNIAALNHDTIKDYIPNVFAEVEGEQSLYSKIVPFLNSAKDWIEKDYLGSDDFLREAHQELALKILVNKAFADAAPSLDLTMTATGFGVVSTGNLAPASKERVDRLIKSLRQYADVNLAVLIDICRKNYPEWRESDCGQYYCATLLTLSDCLELQSGQRHRYPLLRERAMHFEAVIAQEYLGYDLMSYVRDGYNSGVLGDIGVTSKLRGAVRGLCALALDKNPERISMHVVWNHIRPIMNDLKLEPELYAIWSAEMGDKYTNAGFVNDISGGYYF